MRKVIKKGGEVEIKSDVPNNFVPLKNEPAEIDVLKEALINKGQLTVQDLDAAKNRLKQ